MRVLPVARRHLANTARALAFILPLFVGACEPDPGCQANPAAPCPTTSAATSAELAVGPIAQQTEVWCWAASTEMVLLYYGEPNLNPVGDYQCGIVGAYWYIVGGPSHPCVSNCYLCQTGASSFTEVQRILTGYGQVAQMFGVPARVLTSESRFGQLSVSEIREEIDHKRPIIAGVSFPGQPTLPGISGHVVVVSGYDTTVPDATVTIHDPYPYERFIPAAQNPYLVAGGVYLGPGTYRIAVKALAGPSIVWGNSVYAIQ